MGKKCALGSLIRSGEVEDCIPQLRDKERSPFPACARTGLDSDETCDVDSHYGRDKGTSGRKE